MQIEFGDAIFCDCFTGDAGVVGPEITAKVREGLETNYNEISSGNVDKLTVMPVESFLPMIMLRYVFGFARKQEISSENLDFGFDPEMLLEGVRPTPSKKIELLKEIHSEFTVSEEGEDPKFVQLIMDENTLNAFILDFVIVERAFSLRSFLRTDPKFSEMLA